MCVVKNGENPRRKSLGNGGRDSGAHEGQVRVAEVLHENAEHGDAAQRIQRGKNDAT